MSFKDLAGRMLHKGETATDENPSQRNESSASELDRLKSFTPMAGGTGQHHPFHIELSVPEPLTTAESYLGVDVVAASVNRDSGFLKSKTAVGSVDITIGKAETINRLIGPYDLDHGATVAPLFNVPLLQDQPYHGDRIAIVTKLQAMEKGNEMFSLLQAVVDWGAQASSAYLPLLVPGLATAAAAVAPNEAANKKLMDSLKQYIFSSDEKIIPIFEPQGIRYDLLPEQLSQAETFVLFHRGSSFRDTDLKVREDAEIPMPYFVGTKDEVLTDGAWILLRIRRHNKLDGVRPWDQAKEKLLVELQDLLQRLSLEDVTSEQANAILSPDPTGQTNLYSAFQFLHRIILSDPALTREDRSARARQLAEEFMKFRSEVTAARRVHQLPSQSES